MNDSTLTEDQRRRYLRNTMLSGVGEDGQMKLLGARVAVVGAGGLGSPAALYLGAAGVGAIGLIDGDRVELSNLQRQIVHATPDIGVRKPESAARKIEALNPDVRVEIRCERLSRDNAEEALGGFDFVLDCTDNLLSKFLIADACHFLGKACAHAGIDGFTGQMMTVLPGKTACYRCLFTSPPPGSTPEGEGAGVAGFVPGVLGTLQAAEAIKHILGMGDLLTDRLLIFDALEISFRTVELSRSATCPLCGVEPTVRARNDSDGGG